MDIAVEKAVDNFVDYLDVQCELRAWRQCSMSADGELAARVPSGIQAVSRETFKRLNP